MFAEQDLKEAESSPVLGPAYFDARRVAERFVSKFEAEQFKPIIDKLSEELTDRMQSDLDDYLLSNAEMNLQSELWRMVDNSVQALMSGEGWALKRYALSERYNDGEKIRKAVALHIPKELQDARIVDLETENERLRKDLSWYESRN